MKIGAVLPHNKLKLCSHKVLLIATIIVRFFDVETEKREEEKMLHLECRKDASLANTPAKKKRVTSDSAALGTICK